MLGFMRIYYPGLVIIPLLLFLMAGYSLVNPNIWNFWPVTLIATGLEEIYLWASAKSTR